MLSRTAWVILDPRTGRLGRERPGADCSEGRGGGAHGDDHDQSGDAPWAAPCSTSASRSGRALKAQKSAGCVALVVGDLAVEQRVWFTGDATVHPEINRTKKGKIMNHNCPTLGGAAPSSARPSSARRDATKRPALNRRVTTGALCALVGLAGSTAVAPTVASAAPLGVGAFAPGSIVVAQGGTIAGTGGSGTGTTVKEDGGVEVYPPGSNGNVAPEASFTKGMYGPFVVVFDPSGDLWAANVDNGTLVELTKAQLAMPDPVPAVTISAASGALDDPYGMAFDPRGNLWVVGNKAKRVYEYTKGQLASSGSPTPHATISDFPGTPLGTASTPPETYG